MLERVHTYDADADLVLPGLIETEGIAGSPSRSS